METEPEDGRLLICDRDDDHQGIAFTPFGIECLKELVGEHKGQAAVRHHE